MFFFLLKQDMTTKTTTLRYPNLTIEICRNEKHTLTDFKLLLVLHFLLRLRQH